MLFAVLSDVHANIEALDAVLDDVPAGAELLHLGDLVGYGPNPNEVVTRLRHVRGVRGNHDDAALGLLDLERLNDSARDSSIWAAKQLTLESSAYLVALPYVLTIDTEPNFPFTLVHGSPYYPERFKYIHDRTDAFDAFSCLATQLAIVGHTHYPESYSRIDGRFNIVQVRRGRDGDSDVLEIEPGSKYVVNVGSVGQPRDDNPHASYVLLDTDARTVAWRRVAYDFGVTQEKIRSFGLPSRNAERLAYGR